MKKLLNLFRKSNPAKELAPQITSWQRDALLRPGPSANGLPYEAYAAMESDSMIQTALTLKRLGIMASPASIEPSADTSDARRNADFVAEAFERMEGSPLTILENAMDAFARGWSIQESVYRHDQGRWWLQATRPKDVSLFGIDLSPFGQTQGLRLELPGDPPVDLPRDKFIIHRHRPNFSHPKGKSDLDAAYSHYVSKTSLLRAWKLHLERFASPTMLGSYGSAATAADQDAVLSALNSLATTTAFVFPNEFQISSVDPQTGASTGYMEAIEFHNREIARAILGQTLTTDEGRRVGSLALGKVHLQVLVLQLEFLRRDLADKVINEQVIRPLIDLNFGPSDYPIYRFEPASLEAFQHGRLL